MRRGPSIYLTGLAPGASETLTFTWDTDEVRPGTYAIRAEARTVTRETDTDDNALIDGTVTVEERPRSLVAWIISRLREWCSVLMAALRWLFRLSSR